MASKFFLDDKVRIIDGPLKGKQGLVDASETKGILVWIPSPLNPGNRRWLQPHQLKKEGKLK